MQTLLKYIFAFIILASSFPSEAKKISYRFSAKESKEEKKGKQTAGSFRVDVSEASSDDKYHLGQISFSGFDKKLNSGSESFFVTNRTDRTMTVIMLEIEYLTPDGRQLHKQFHEVKCHIPPGETRKVDIKSWDTQHSFYYVKSAPAKASGSPFTVRFLPQAFYLRY